MKPTLNLLRAVILWTVLGLIVAILNQWEGPSVGAWPEIWSGLSSLSNTAWWIMGWGFLACTIIDWVLLHRAKNRITITRVVAPSLPVGEWSTVELTISHDYKSKTSVNLFDHHPPDMEINGLPIKITLLPGETSKTKYAIRPTIRGNALFNPAQILHHSILGLWQRNHPTGNCDEIKVYPNFTSMNHYNLLAAENQTSQMGIKLKQRRGEGLDFHQLRNYRPGDSLRQIDWKASSRKKKIISKEYQDERDQQIIFLLDCGRRMRSQDDELSHFDHALNSMLLLSYVALRQGDAVGLMSFGARPKGASHQSLNEGKPDWLSPVKGISSINTILNQAYDLHASTRASDYSSAAKELMNRQHKRALIIIVSNARDESIDDLLPAIKLLRQRHLVLFANMREASLDNCLIEPITDFDSALRYAGTIDYLESRKQIHNSLREHNVIAIDSTPKQLPSKLVNEYYEIKRGGVL